MICYVVIASSRHYVETGADSYGPFVESWIVGITMDMDQAEEWASEKPFDEHLERLRYTILPVAMETVLAKSASHWDL